MEEAETGTQPATQGTSTTTPDTHQADTNPQGSHGNQTELQSSKEGGGEQQVEQIVQSGDNPECPDCGAMLVLQEGCRKCPTCGWSKC